MGELGPTRQGAEERLDLGGLAKLDRAVDGVEEVVVQDMTQEEGARVGVADVGKDAAQDRGREAGEAVL